MIEKSTKESIIRILGARFPLTLKQISMEVKIHRNISYQAVYKTIHQLMDQGIINKIDKQYFLNKSWIDDKTQKFSRLYSNYFGTEFSPNQIDRNKRVQMFRFHSHEEVLKFIVEIYIKGLTGDVYVSLRRMYPIIPPSLIQLIKKLTKTNNLYILCRNNGVSDRWAARFLKGLGAKVKTGAEVPVINSICIGDTVLQYFFFFQESYKDKIYSFYDRFQRKSRMSLLKITSDILHKRGELYIIIIRYPVYVDNITTAIKSEFGR